MIPVAEFNEVQWARMTGDGEDGEYSGDGKELGDRLIRNPEGLWWLDDSRLKRKDMAANEQEGNVQYRRAFVPDEKTRAPPA